MTTYKFELKCDATVVDAFEEGIAEFFEITSSFNLGDWNKSIDTKVEGDLWSIIGYRREAIEVEIYTAVMNIAERLGVAIPQVCIGSESDDYDWISENQKSFVPQVVGNFYIYPSHYVGECPNGSLGLQIDAGQAFGTGEHETTKLCLEAISDLCNKLENQPPKKVLDMGCGTGILAAATAKLLENKVNDLTIVAVDIEEQAIKMTNRTIVNNGLDIGFNGEIITQHGDGFNLGVVSEYAPYNLIVANILANPLIEMAEDMVKHLSDDGYIILSGFLMGDVPDIIESYGSQGMICEDIKGNNDWYLVVMVRK